MFYNANFYFVALHILRTVSHGSFHGPKKKSGDDRFTIIIAKKQTKLINNFHNFIIRE